MKSKMIIDEHGTKRWWLNRKLHREDGPAVEYQRGTRYWYLNGQRHREDGPAIEDSNGNKYWYLNDKQMTEEEHDNLMFIKWCTTKVEYIG